MSTSATSEKYDIIVVGGGHAGCEAALAAARMGKNVLMLVTDMASIAMMPCNPAIGGTGKGHLVHEIDALGGEMGVNIDKAFIQSRMLNTAKGPAVHSLRAQADKEIYHEEMQRTIAQQEGLCVRENEVIDVLTTTNGDKKESIFGVQTAEGKEIGADVVVLATGTFLGGKTFRGDDIKESGPAGLEPANALAKALRQRGLPMRRFKTGTPARALASSMDFSKMTEQKGDEEISPFSFMNEELSKEQVSCYLTYTTEATHQVIRDNMERSALFGGYIEGIGPRYCPSIEDKIRRFPDRERHQLFIEPEGLDTDEMYIQGMSTSMPIDVQEQFYRTIPGLEDLVITKPGYAIEYDCIDPQSLTIALEHKEIDGLYCAGQICGSSGYEEAAAQGLIAGINAVLKIDGKAPFVLGRDEAYIGVLIDDLVTKGTNEPYRIMTSRAEYRLLLRQDNADERLTEKSFAIGLATRERVNKFKAKKSQIEEEISRLEHTRVTPEAANEVLERCGSTPVLGSVHLAEIMRRPQVTYEALAAADPDRPPLPRRLQAQIEVRIKYAGYVQKQQQRVEKFRRLENKALPSDLDYENINGLRIEARQKLSAIKPESLGQAGRISGVSPADINVLLIYLEREKRSRKENTKEQEDGQT